MAAVDRNVRVESEANRAYWTPWVANNLSWATSDTNPFRLAISSYIQDYKNYVDIVEMNSHGQLVCRATWEHCYPPTKTMFPPRQLHTDHIITTADYLRLWEIKPLADSEFAEANDQARRHESKLGTTANAGGKSRRRSIKSAVTQKHVFDSSKPNDFCSPVTSCDWNSYNMNMIGCCSIDTTVTIWDLTRCEQVSTIVAHDKDVYDIAFLSADTFATCGADGSVRIFDLRSLAHSTVLYETPGLSPILRLASNQLDSNYIATTGIQSADAFVIDIRCPSVVASHLANHHKQAINGMAWSPQSAQNISTVGEDGTVCIWAADGDCGKSLFSCPCRVPINNVAWRGANQEEWIAITTGEGAELLRV